MTTLKYDLQTLLFHYPLYKYMNTDGGMHVLVVGWNEAIEAFVDSALALGQLPGHTLQITVCTDSSEEHLFEYAAARPMLDEYIDVKADDKDLSDSVRHYGTLRFYEAEKYREALRQAISNADASALPNYVFIGTKNLSSHQALLELLTSRALQCSADGRPMLLAMAEEDQLFIQQVDTIQPFHSEPLPSGGMLSLQDMAFNAHLVWAMQSAGDIQAEWKRFTDPGHSYNLQSSMSYAMSIPYKLWSVGIDFLDPELAAAAFEQKLADDEDHSLLYQLMDMEQRRWVMEKIAAGYKTAYCRGDSAPFEQFAKNASVRTPKAHICIQHSEPAAPLEGEWYQKKNHQHWDVPSVEDEMLDDLDRMSIDLHRFMKKKADSLRNERYIDRSPALKAIGDLIANKENQIRRELAGRVTPNLVNPLRTEFNRFLFCLRAIMDGSTPYAKQYDAYEADLLHAFKTYTADSLPLAQKNLQIIKRDMFPAIEANQYRNYKQNNQKLVQNIPFVLTYKRFQRLAVPFSTAVQRTNINDLIFTNVASATVIKPELLLYLYRAEPAVNPDTFDAMLRSSAAFLANNRIPCAIRLAICFDSNISSNKLNKWHQNLNRLIEENVIEQLIIDQEDAPETFFFNQIINAQVTIYDGTTSLFASEYRQVNWLEQIKASVGYFEMNPATKQFFADDSCRWLMHIYDVSFLRIDDMFTLLNCENKEHEYPDCTEYVFMDDRSDEPEPLFLCLWKIYTGEAIGQKKESAIYYWNRMCEVLDPLNTSKAGGAGRLDKGKLKFQKVVNPDPKKTADGFKPFKKNEVGAAEKFLAKIGSMYSYTGDKLLNVKYDAAGRVDTIEATRDSIVKILTKAGTILEVYCYYRALETGYFDDIACSCTFYWGDREFDDSQRKNEIDLILTKGFQSIIAECKATADLDQDYYHKLNTISDLFGINARKVLIANTYSSNPERNRRNQEQISRGELMDILTINKSEDIARIGTRLASLMRQY